MEIISFYSNEGQIYFHSIFYSKSRSDRPSYMFEEKNYCLNLFFKTNSNAGMFIY